MDKIAVTLIINGREYALSVEPRRTLVDVIRDDCALFGTHIGCEHGVCGACTVIVDGEPVRSIRLIDPGWNHEIAFDGTTIATVSGGAIYLHDVAGGPTRKFLLPIDGAEKSYWYPFFSPDGTELWLHAAGSLELLRFKLP